VVSVTSGVQVLDRAVEVLDTIARRGPCQLAELVSETGLPRPTAHRIAVALERNGVLARDGAGRFVLGARAATWGAAAAQGLATIAQPVLARLSEATGESAQLYLREGSHRVCVAAYERPSGLRDTVPVGAVLPLDRGSGAKVLAAWAQDGSSLGIDDRELRAVRRRGWAESAGEREAGVASVSAPVWGHGDAIVAAISVSGPIDRMGQHPGRRLAPAVVNAAATLSRAVTTR